MREFFQTYYHPANASLSLAGDIDTEQAFELAEKYFGGLPAGPAVDRVRVDAQLTESATLVLEDRVELPRLYISWHSPAMFADDDAELDIVADVLAHGKTSRLYKSLVYERRVATDVSAYQHSREMGGMFQIACTAAAGVALPELNTGDPRRGRRAWRTAARPPPRSSAAWRRPKRSSSTGCRPSAGSAARAIS